MRKYRIFGIGEAVLDIIFRDGQPTAAVPGGSTFNSMVSLGRTVPHKFPEIPVQMISQLGDDIVSDMTISFMKDNGMKTDGIRIVPSYQSPISLAMLDSRNDAHYEFFRDRNEIEFKTGEIDFNKNDIVVFGSFFAVGNYTREHTGHLISSARKAGSIIYYDINFRKSHLSRLEEIKDYIEENCRQSDIVRASNEDIMNLYGSDDPEYVYGRYISKLCSTYICTEGEGITRVFTPSGHFSFPVQKVEAVSTIGAGDNFNAGIVYGLIENEYTREDIKSSGKEFWDRIIPRAAAFASNVCMSPYNYVDMDFHRSL